MPHWGIVPPHCFLVDSAFRATIHSRFTTFRVASSVSAFRVVITSHFDVQTHHHHFLVSTFRAIIVFSVRRSEPSSVFRLTFRVASSVSAFRVVITFQFDVQSHHHHFSVSAFRAITVFSVSVFKAIIGFQINIQNHHHHFSAPAFRVIIHF